MPLYMRVKVERADRATKPALQSASVSAVVAYVVLALPSLSAEKKTNIVHRHSPNNERDI